MSPRRRDIGHDRARDWLAERIDWPLDEEREAALEAHLGACAACRDLDAAYAADRLALRQMAEPLPPRDLPARVLAALDAETRRTRAPRPAATLKRQGLRRTSSVAFGSLLTIALVMVAGALLGTPGTIIMPGPLAGATPFAISPVNLAYVGVQGDTVRIYRTKLEQACPPSNASCADFTPQTGQEVVLPAAVTNVRGLTLDRDGRHAAISASSASSAGGATTFYVVDLGVGPATVQSASPSPPPTPPATPQATPSPSPSASATPAATASPRPSPTPARSLRPSATPSDGSPSPTAAASMVPASPAASGSAGASATPSALPAAQPRAILQDVIAAGSSPAWSPDGSTLAFSAMPADGSTGPDIYTWHPGDERAVAITTDHASSFASWAGRRIVGSTTVPSPSDLTKLSPRSFVLDPETGERRMIDAAIWLPSVDATGQYMVAWEGTLVQGARAPEPEQGQLVFAAWKRIDPFAEPDAATPAPTAIPTPERTALPRESASPRPGRSGTRLMLPSPTAEPTPSATVAASVPGVMLSTPEPLDASPDPALATVRDWVVGWSPDGSAFAAWTSSVVGSDIGTLSLFAVDQTGATIDRGNSLLAPTSSRRGFSIAEDRLAWATVPDGQGRSQLHVLVWGTYGRGEIRSHDLTQQELLPAF